MKKILIKTREQWRDWLSANHDKEERVLLVRYKRHTGKPAPNQKESMDEAICFGWIDTTAKRIDDDKWATTYVRRNDNGRWSNNTLKYAKRLIKEGRMTPAGLKRYNEGLKKPTIDHGLPRNPDIPSDLKVLFDKNKKARENFENFSPSTKRYYIYWIEKAKREETRNKRVKEVFENSLENRKPGL
ncbi:YdeI family protein [Bacteroidota bacterium]